MVGVTGTPQGTGTTNALAKNQVPINTAPWYHGNPVYSSYLHRAKFPDLAANTLRGLVGVATKEPAEVDLPKSIEYLEETATVDGRNLFDLFECSVSEVCQTARYALVLDFRQDNTMYIAGYPSETYINWRFEVINGERVQTYAEFETCELDAELGELKKSLAYELLVLPGGKKHVATVTRYTNGKMDEQGTVALSFQGKELERLPISNLGAEENTPEIDSLPLLGISDCALDIYRHSADLNQAHFMSCNPTLLFTGVDEDDAPKVVGTTVAMCLSDAASDGKYLTTDTSALSHVSGYIQDVFQEAMGYGAQILGPTKRAAESAEALALRQAASGATLVTMVKRCGAGVETILGMAAELAGSSPNDVLFAANLDFAETLLSAQEVTALLNSMMSGGISHTTYLENLSAAGILRGRTVEEEMDLIEEEGASTVPATPSPPEDATNNDNDAEEETK
jgi:hypothetical protein